MIYVSRTQPTPRVYLGEDAYLSVAFSDGFDFNQGHYHREGVGGASPENFEELPEESKGTSECEYLVAILVYR